MKRMGRPTGVPWVVAPRYRTEASPWAFQDRKNGCEKKESGERQRRSSRAENRLEWITRTLGLVRRQELRGEHAVLCQKAFVSWVSAHNEAVLKKISLENWKRRVSTSDPIKARCSQSAFSRVSRVSPRLSHDSRNSRWTDADSPRESCVVDELVLRPPILATKRSYTEELESAEVNTQKEAHEAPRVSFSPPEIECGGLPPEASSLERDTVPRVDAFESSSIGRRSGGRVSFLPTRHTENSTTMTERSSPSHHNHRRYMRGRRIVSPGVRLSGDDKGVTQFASSFSGEDINDLSLIMGAPKHVWIRKPQSLALGDQIISGEKYCQIVDGLYGKRKTPKKK